MNVTDHFKEHIALGLDFRFPTDGKTYFKFSSNKIELYVNGVKKAEWT